ncbi:flagellar hook-length control protein FliK [Sulfurimonas sp.]
MINLSIEKKLNIITTNTNKALSKVLQELNPESLQKFTAQKDIGSILSSIFKKSGSNIQQDKELVKLLKNNPTFKEFTNTQKSLSELKTLLQTTLQTEEPILKGKTKQILQNLNKILQEFQQTPKANNASINLEKKFLNSGIFLESKIKNLRNPKEIIQALAQNLSKELNNSKIPSIKLLNQEIKAFLKSELFLSDKLNTSLTQLKKLSNSSIDKTIYPKDVLFLKDTKNIISQLQKLNTPHKLTVESAQRELFSNDLKANLLQSKEELLNSTLTNKQELLKHIDKLSMQIDYYQLLSHLSNASALYIPYDWSELEDGNITLMKKDKNTFFCDIELHLKEYGNLKLRLGLFDTNQLNINISCQSDALHSLLKQNLKTLKEQLYKVGITPKEIRFVSDKTQSSEYVDNLGIMDMGFEVKA